MGLVLYNLLLPFYLIVALPGLLIKMRRRGGYGAHFWQRFARYDKNLHATLSQQQRPWWIHAVSVGEVLVALKLIQKIQQLAPEQPLVLSTTSSTGHATAVEKAPAGITVIYNPLDLPGIVHRALDELRPAIVVLMESELWPNLIATAARRRIPVVIANARLSPASGRRYARFHKLTSPTLNRLTAVLTQEGEDGPRWEATGLKPEKIHHTGSIKFDPAADQAVSEAKLTSLRQILTELWADCDDPYTILVGSSHPGEELAVAQVFARLRGRFPQLRLLLVPRHFERANEILQQFAQAGLAVEQRSKWPQRRTENSDILLVDSTGELRLWYALADAVIVGKSFLTHGGQNPVEPILAGRPVIVGPHMENFESLTQQLRTRRGLVQIDGIHQLEATLASWITDPTQAASLAQRGREAIMAHAGATERAVEKLLTFAVDSARVPI